LAQESCITVTVMLPVADSALTKVIPITKKKTNMNGSVFINFIVFMCLDNN